MNKICTSIEQSKKLIKLGIDINTSDCSWILNPNGSNYTLSFTAPMYCDIPAWSLTALLDLIPNYVINKIDDKIYANLYYDSKFCYDNLVDAAFELLIRLKENNKL